MNNRIIHIEQAGDHELVLLQHFSVKHPNARYINKGGWDGWYRKYNAYSGNLALPFLNDLKNLCRKHGIPLNIIDDRKKLIKSSIDNINKSMLDGIELEDYQINAVRATYDNDIGIIELPTGAGKTEVMAAVAKYYSTKTVIIADIRVVIEQIQERLNLRNVEKYGNGVGMFYGGKMPNGESIVVGSIQSATSPPISYKETNPDAYKTRLNNARKFQKIIRSSNLLMVDEADKASSPNFKELFSSFFKGRYRYGFSGTPFDDDPVKNITLIERLGTVIARSERSLIQSKERIIPIKFSMIAFGEDGNKKESSAFDLAERDIIIDNPEFHNLVNRIILAFPGDRTLVLVDTSNVEDLGMNLEKVIDNSSFIYGKTGKSTRNKVIQKFENGELKCLIGGRILKRGLDLKGGTENLIICGGGKKSSNFNQMIGRSVRRNNRGWARVFSFFFMNNKYLYDHSRQQLKTVLDMGYKADVIFKKGKVDGTKLVKSKFRLSDKLFRPD